MKKILTVILTLALALGLLASCGQKGNGDASTPQTPAVRTPEELTQLYTGAINNCGSEGVEYNPPVDQAGDDTELLFQMMGLNADDMTAFSISASMMNVQAYGIALVMPAEGKEQAVTDALQNYIEQQKTNFENYLADQYEVANSARLETLSDGTVAMVMCEGQDAIFDSIKAAVEA